MNIILFGPPGSGKGTQADKIVNQFNFYKISTGDLLRQEINKKTNKGLINVFVPTTPNPTSGFLLMIPRRDLVYLDMSFEEASKFIVSAGTSETKKK